MRRAAVGILLAAAVAGGAVAYLASRPDRDRPAGGAGRYRNVVLFCVDTLRADSLTAYGGDAREPKMPGLDAFAATSTVFLDASSHAAWTLPSISTLLTGLEPSHHGVAGQSDVPLLPQVVTLASRLRDAGYFTAAITSGGWISPEHGLKRGFDAFETEFDVRTPETVVASWEKVRDRAKPFFLFLHTVAPHDPYGPKWPPGTITPDVERDLEAQAKRLTAYADAHDGALPPDALDTLGTMFLTDGAKRNAFGRHLDPPHMRLFWARFLDWIDGAYATRPGRAQVEAALLASYRAGLRNADDVVTRTLTSLDALPLPKDTLVIVVADHGEAFGEHGELVHGRYLYDELVRVPLLVRAPGALPRGPVRGPCGLADVFPTVLELLGLDVTAPIDGRSLLPLARGREGGHPVIAEEWRPMRTGDALDDRTLTSVRTERAKFVLTRDGRGATVTEELFDLAADPREKASLPLVRADSLGSAFCAAVMAVRAAPRSATRPGPPADAGTAPATCVGPR